MSIKKKIQKHYYKLKLKIQKTSKVQPFKDLFNIGTEYGAWIIPGNLLNKSSICYLAGAAEDISFDVGIVEKYKSKVYIFDPTEKSKVHFEELIESVEHN